jgi:hypothetical protein
MPVTDGRLGYMALPPMLLRLERPWLDMGEWPELYDDTEAGVSAGVSKAEADDVTPGIELPTLLSVPELE